MRNVKFLSLAAVFALSACGPKVASIELTPNALSFNKKETKPIVAVAKDAEKKKVENVQIAFESSDPKVATVDASGKVTAVDSGDARITAHFEQISAVAQIKVSIPASISFAPADAKLEGVGAKVHAVAKVVDSKGKEMKETVAYATEDAKVATVSPTGEITAAGAGETNIVATVAGTVKANFKVTVTVPVLTTVEADKALEIKVGESANIKAMGKDADGKEIAGVAFTYASADEKIATVDAAGAVKAVKKGKTKVTVTSADKSATVEVVVKK